jgi:hypothetical protein
MIDCHICGLPMEVQGQMELNDEGWVGLLCVDGHFVLLREAEAPGAATH